MHRCARFFTACFAGDCFEDLDEYDALATDPPTPTESEIDCVLDAHDAALNEHDLRLHSIEFRLSEFEKKSMDEEWWTMETSSSD